MVEPQHGDSYAKLLDFGIAKLVGDKEVGNRTQTGVLMGTPAYMSPEQCKGVGVDHRTDIYALGMILYEMFAGRLPFDGSFAELLTHHLITVPAPPSRHAQLPPALDRLIVSCVEKDPAQRPQSAEALWKALELALPPDGAAVLPVRADGGGTAGRCAGHVVAGPRADLPEHDHDAGPEQPAVAAGRGAGAVVVVVVLALVNARSGGGNAVVPVPSPLPVPAVVAPAPPPPGHARIVIKDADGARVFVDGKLIASGVREAQVSGHHARPAASAARRGRRAPRLRAHVRRGRRRRRRAAGRHRAPDTRARASHAAGQAPRPPEPSRPRPRRPRPRSRTTATASSATISSTRNRPGPGARALSAGPLKQASIRNWPGANFFA